MDDLLQAFAVLDLAPGASWSQILARYRQLVKIWHPDRFLDPKEKKAAEEKIKAINTAREVLAMHFSSAAHKEATCPCAAADSTSNKETAPKSNLESETKSEQKANAKQHSQPKAKSEPKPKPKPEPPPEAWNWWSTFCNNLDIGTLNHDEPGWYETVRRALDKIYGKHPGDTILDTWNKPVLWTKDHKNRCLIFALFVMIAFDRLALAIDPQAFMSESAREKAARLKNLQRPADPLQSGNNPADNNIQKADIEREQIRREIEKERQYFEEKWRERRQPLSPT
ncbi:MAG: J domain-containing protein [Cyanobacteria bacterium REEB67]|nr:J domain-containing protein [Cyanobacteria bacterium REEB67]